MILEDIRQEEVYEVYHPDPPSELDLSLSSDRNEEEEEPFSQKSETKGEKEPEVVKKKTKSFDFCPHCKSVLDPFAGKATVDLKNFSLSVKCVRCNSNIVIKDVFNERTKQKLLVKHEGVTSDD